MIKTLKKFFDFCGEEHRRMFIKSIWLGVLSAICTAMRIPAVYLVVKALVNDSMSSAVLIESFIILIVSVAATIIINMSSTMLQTKAGYRTCANKRMEIAQHLRYLPMGWFNENSLGEVANVTTNVMENMANVGTRVVMITTKGFITSAVVMAAIFIFDWRIGIVTFIGLAIYMLFNMMMQQKEQSVSVRKTNADETLVSRVLEYVQGITEVKNYNLSKSTMARAAEAIEECRSAAFAMELPSVAYMFLQYIANKFTGVAVCASALLFYFDGTLQLDYTLMMLICSYILFEQLDSAGTFSSLFRIIDIGVTKAQAILAVKPMDTEGKDIQPQNLDIQLENVDFSYDKKKIIDGISMSIPEKAVVAIVGPSGSGKTTLCNLMARFWDVQGGSVSLGGVNVKDYSYDSLIKNFSFVFQRTYLFSDTIANNIRFGKQDATDDEVVAAAKKARCHDFIMGLPDGYSTIIGEGGATVSGGERQRITIARAIMKDAPIIILDEATANVDPENEKELVEAINELTHEKTVIMIAHRLKTVRGADCIYVIDKGRIAQQGTHAELMSQEGIYRSFVADRRKAVGWKV